MLLSVLDCISETVFLGMAFFSFALMRRNVLAKSRFLPEISRCQIRPFFVLMRICLRKRDSVT